jgi:hypothetical protein
MGSPDGQVSLSNFLAYWGVVRFNQLLRPIVNLRVTLPLISPQLGDVQC